MGSLLQALRSGVAHVSLSITVPLRMRRSEGLPKDRKKVEIQGHETNERALEGK